MNQYVKRISAVIFLLCCLAAAFCFLPAAAHAEEGDTEAVDNGIPVLYINIDESQGTIEDMIASPDHSVYCCGTMSIVVPEGFHYVDFPDLSCESVTDLSISIRGRGNSSWKKDAKKPFKIKLDKKADIFGLGKNKHWAILANASDESLIRDRITAWLGDEMGFDFTPRGVPVDVVMTGENYGTVFLGSYYFTETVRVGENRVEIEELAEDDTDPEVITGGYLLQMASQLRAGSLDRFYTKRGVEWGTETPSFDTDPEALLGSDKDGDADAEEKAVGQLNDAYENHAQQEYIQNYIQVFEDLLFEQGIAYRDRMDVETAAKYWLMSIFPLNSDAFATGSTYIYKDRDSEGEISRLYWGPLWDYDYAWDFKPLTEGLEYGHTWMKPLFYDKGEGGFVQEVHKQWPRLKALAEELIKDGGIIDQYAEETRASANKDHERWRDGEGNYQEKIDKLKDWIRNRIAWFDENIGEIDNLIHKITLMTDDDVYMTDFETADEMFSLKGLYPEKEGYTFLYWMDEAGNPVDVNVEVKEDVVLTAKFVPDDEVTHATDIAFQKDCDIIRRNPFISRYQIQYKVLPTDAMDKRVKWTSSNETFAQVDEDGLVTFSGNGEATFTAELKHGKTRTFTLTVSGDELPVVHAISPDEEKIKLSAGEQSPFIIHTDPSPAQIYSYEYRSEKESVVTVDEMGVLTAVKPGRTVVHVTVTAPGEDGDAVLETSVVVSVSNKPLSDTPKTGNNDHLWYYVILSAGSLGLLLLLFRKKKNTA